MNEIEINGILNDLGETEGVNIVETTENTLTSYDVIYNIYMIVSVLTFLVTVFYLYRYLKSVFKRR